MARGGVVVALAALAALAGCELLVDIPNASLAGDAGDDGPSACSSAQECAAPTPICDLAAGECVECVASTDCPTTEACVDRACGACTEDAECASAVCLPDGACADPARVLYASSDGAGTCTAADPCAFDIALAMITPATDVIDLAPGLYERPTGVTIVAPTTISGHGATFRSATAMFETLFNVTGAGELTLLGLVTEGNLGSIASCDAGKITLHRTRWLGGVYGGSMQCEVAIDRATITGMVYYALSITGGPVTMTNSYVVGNGGMSIIGGVYLFDVTLGGTIEHTTIAANSHSNNGTPYGGVRCVNSPVALRSNIIHGNEAPNIDPACVVDYSVIDLGYGGTGTNNNVVEPAFVSPPTGDYHLSPGSPARGLADPASVMAYDGDGEPRPQPAGGASDPGADEIP